MPPPGTGTVPSIQILGVLDMGQWQRLPETIVGVNEMDVGTALNSSTSAHLDIGG